MGLDRHDVEAAASLCLSDLDHLSALHFPLLRDGGPGMHRRGAPSSSHVRALYRPAPLGTCSHTGVAQHSDPLLSWCASFVPWPVTL